MIKFKLNGKSINVASSWDDLTFDQFLQILDSKDDLLQLVSICSGLDYETLKKSVIVGLDSVIQAMQFIRTKANYPDTTKKLGKYKLPLDPKGEFNPQYKRLDQFEDMRKAMIASDKGVKSVTEAYATYCAIYLQELRDGNYDYQKAMAMVDEVKQMPAKEVIPAGSFFLIKLLNLSIGIKKTSPNTTQSRKKLKPVSKISKKSSGHTLRSMRSR